VLHIILHFGLLSECKAKKVVVLAKDSLLLPVNVSCAAISLYLMHGNIYTEIVLIFR